jgi:hypothetical protein
LVNLTVGCGHIETPARNFLHGNFIFLALSAAGSIIITGGKSNRYR